MKLSESNLSEPLGIMVSNDVKEMGLKEAGDILIKLDFAMTAGKLRMAEIIHHVIKNKLYVNDGFPTLDAWIDTLGLGRRSIYYYKSVVEKLGRAGIPREQLENMKWSKAVAISKVCNNMNSSYWVPMALDSKITVQDLESKIRASRNGSVAPPKDPLCIMSFKVTQGQKETIEGALEEAKKLSSIYPKGHLLSAICLQFLTDRIHGSDESTASLLEWYLQRLEDNFGIKLTVDYQCPKSIT